MNKTMKRALTSLFWTLCGLLLLIVYFQLEYVAAGQISYGKESYLHPSLIDSFFPLTPSFIVFYMLGYALPFSLCFIVKNPNERIRLFISIFLMFSISFIFFNFFPVKMEKIIAEGVDPLSKLTRVHQEQDSYYNCFPSLHVSLNVFTALLFLRAHRRHLIWVAPLMGLITVSTLFVKQHLFIDVLGGVALAGGIYAFFISSVRLTLRIRRMAFYASICVIVFSMAVRWKLMSKIYVVLTQIIGESIRAFFGSTTAQISIGAILLLAIGVTWSASAQSRSENRQ